MGAEAERRDVLIHATPAELHLGKNPTREQIAAAVKAGSEPPTKDEIIQAQDIELRRLRHDLYMTHATAGTIANATVALVHMFLELKQGGPGDREVTIPRELALRLEGAVLQCSRNSDGETVLAYVPGIHGQKEPVVFEVGVHG